MKFTNYKNYKLIIGIDPGINTGFAVWDYRNKIFIKIKTLSITQAIDEIRELSKNYDRNIFIRFEDARKRRWFGRVGSEVLQGVGSIKRDCTIWECFLKENNISFEAVEPKIKMTKWKSDYFMKVTGWKERTSNHSRDAAVLVFQI